MAQEITWDKQSAEAPTQDKELQYKKYGTLNQDTLEMMLIGHLLDSAQAPEFLRVTKAADKIMESGIKGKLHFENDGLAILFDECLNYYRMNQERCTPETYRELLGLKLKPEEGLVVKEKLTACYAAVVARKGYAVGPLITRLKEKWLVKVVDKRYKEFHVQCNDQKTGPTKAVESFRSHVITDLADVEGSEFVAGDIIEDFPRNIADLVNMKENPDKYNGKKCGIKAIDEVTRGFVAGQMTVIIGANGGYKTSTMMNIALGCWRRKMNVLYVVLETDRFLVEKRMMAMGTMKVNTRKLLDGQMSSPNDAERLAEFEKERAVATDPEAIRKLELLIRIRKNIITSAYKDKDGRIIPEATDEYLLNSFYDFMKVSTNKLIVSSTGLNAAKIKVSQIENYIKEQRQVFKPDIVIVDYLGLVQSEFPKERRTDELGDICKHLRKMGGAYGFHVLTAAQYSRLALERIRKHGYDTPEKADLGTDDIADSAQIGNDADFVIMLWKNRESGMLKFMNTKNRHDQKVDDMDVPIDQETGMIESDDVSVDNTQSIKDNLTIDEICKTIKHRDKNAPVHDDSEDSLLGLPPMATTEEDEPSSVQGNIPPDPDSVGDL